MGKYNVGDKFIVEIKEVINSENGTLYRSNFKTLVFDDYGLDSLHQAITPAEDGLVDKAEVAEAYNKGLQDAWELARKIVLPDRNGGMKISEIAKVFEINHVDINDILRTYTPQEALAKLEAYEKEQNEIKVGDVVTDGHSTMLVTGIGGNSGLLFLLGSEGQILVKQNPEWWKKTGKHIDMQSILQQIGGDANV